MPAPQQEPKFTPEEAQRFAALWAGFETGNLSEFEAMGKGRIMRRMVAAKGLRIADALELPEIRKAIDDRLQVVRAANTDNAAVKAEADELRGKLAVVVPKVRELTEALTREKELTAQLRGQLQTRQEPQRMQSNGTGSGAATPSLGAQSWLFELAAVVAAVVLVVMAAFR
jgi:hypothetical protein